MDNLPKNFLDIKVKDESILPDLVVLNFNQNVVTHMHLFGTHLGA